MRALRPKSAAVVLLIGWVLFLIDRWLLPEGSLFLEGWLTVVGLGYVVLAIATLRGKHLAKELIPWATVLLMMWGLLALMGLAADNISTRTWMWSSVFAAATGAVAFVVCCFPLRRRPSWGMLSFLAVGAFLAFAAWFQISQCRYDIHATWCDPRYEQEDRIVATLRTDRTPVRTGHLNGVLGPAYASFEFAERPDLAVAVVPVSATPVETDDADELEWHFGEGDAACLGRSVIDDGPRGFELQFTVDCRR